MNTKIKKLIFISLMFLSSIANAQFFEDLVFQLHSGTQAEMTGMTNPQEGFMLYNTTDQIVYYYDGTNWININSDLWQESSGIMTPTTTTNHLVSITNSSDGKLVGFKAVNTNDTHNYTGAVMEMKGSGADYTNNMYMGKYGDAFWIPSWAGNGVIATDKDLMISALGNTSKIQFQITGGYTSPNNFMDLSASGLAFNTGVRINTFLDEDDFASNSDAGLATQQSIKAYVDGTIANSTSLSAVLGVGHNTNNHNIFVEEGDSIWFGIENNDAGQFITGEAGGDLIIDAQEGVVEIGNDEYRWSGDTFVDNVGGEGMMYSSDYSATFINRSLVDKEYVDNTSYWLKTGTNLSPATAGDDLLLNTGETLSITDMTQGSVPFFGASDILSQDNTNLFWDNTNSRLGIGTNTPSDRLHVFGDFRLTGAFKDINNDAGTAGQLLSTTVTGTDWIDASSVETTTNMSQSTATGVITYTNEDATDQTANVVSADSDNQIEAGNDGGAYLGPTVYTGFFLISSSATGSQNITGLPFQPSQITFVANQNIGSTNIDSDNGTGSNDRGIDNSFGTMNGFARDNGGSITQQVICIGGSGHSINNISRYASSSNCIGVRYGDQDGKDLGKITAPLTSFNSDGFTINITYTNGTVTVNNPNPLRDVQPTDVLNEGLVVLYTAYK